MSFRTGAKRAGVAGAGCLLLLLHAGPGTATELPLSIAEVKNLGIDLAMPQSAEYTTGVAGRGRVVLPPAGDVVVTTAQPGLLVRLHVAPGDDVSRGQLLAELRSPGFIEAQRAFLDAATADALAQARLARDRSLVAEGIASLRRLEETEAAAQGAAAAVAEHRQILRIAGLGDAGIDVLSRSRELHGLLPVRSPIDGVVLEVSARPGAGVTETDPLLRVGDLSTLWLEIEVALDQALRIEPGMSVALQGSAEASARVASVARVADPKTQMVMVRAVVAASVHGLRPGQFIVARIGDGAGLAGRVWSVPATSVIRRGTDHFVFVRAKSGFVVRAVVRLGAQGERVLVAGDLDGETELAATGVSALKALWAGAADGEA